MIKKFDLNEIDTRHTKNIKPELIQNLYMSVGWQKREIIKIKKALKKSLLITSAWHNELLIGIARATGDGVFSATIWDVAVRNNYQKQGVGGLIIKSMLTKLDDCGIPLITLYTDYEKKFFYSKLGFETNTNKIIGMYRFKIE